MDTLERADAELVAECLSGGRDAFRQIVERYQTLICSIAYNGTGDVGRSEDIAQETFITAWGSLRSLREPEKLRGWLCGIVRHRLHHRRRDEAREPLSRAGVFDETADAASVEVSPLEQVVSREEQALLWRCLAQIPELYREPLILFYREHQSIEHVAVALDLSEDAVKQRLSRGRRLLQEEMQSFVETALRRTAPSHAFTLDVLVLLSGSAGPAAAAAAGLGAQGTAAAKTGWLATILAPLAPFLGILAGMAAQWLVIRDLTADRRTRMKRLFQMVAAWTIFIAAAVLGERAMYGWAKAAEWGDRTRFVALVGFWWAFVMVTITLQFLGLGRMAKRCLETARPDADDPGVPVKPATIVALTIGLHVMFSWLVTLAWRMGDAFGALLLGAVLVALGVRAFFRFRNLTQAALGWAVSEHVAWIGGVILLVLNLRTDVWVSLRYGVPVSEASHLLPTVLVPVLTAVLVAWILFLIVTLLPRRSATRDAQR